MIIAFRDKRQSDGKKPRTLNLDIIALRNILMRALDDGWLKTLPLENLRPLKAVSKRRPRVTLPDIERICDATFKALYFENRLARPGETGRPLKNAQQFADYMRVMALCGSRRDESLRVKWSDVDFDRRPLTIGADGLSKNHETRSVDFHPRLEAHLREMATRRAPDSQFLFPSPQRGDKDASAKTFKESLNLARAAAGLTQVGFHDCRHCFIRFDVMSGINFMTLAKWGGHKDGGVLIGKVYGHLADSHRKAQAARLTFGPAIALRNEAAGG